MLSQRSQQKAKSITLLMMMSVVSFFATTQSVADQASANAGPAAEHVSEDTLHQRAEQLRGAIDEVFLQLRASRSLKESIHDGNDVTAIVVTYIPAGMSFDDAEVIIKATGWKIEPSRQGHLIARARMRDRLFDAKHALAVEVVPETSDGFSVVKAVSATIYLAYVPNANNR
jgi:hypothetical protein